VWIPGDGSVVAIEVRADDLGALLVDWLSEVLFLQDARAAAIGGVRVDAVAEHRAAGSVTLAPLPDELDEGVQVKAVTYHQLRVEQTSEGWTATVFFDI
jgi:SHS2 domain-containing protein